MDALSFSHLQKDIILALADSRMGYKLILDSVYILTEITLISVFYYVVKFS